MARRIDRSVLLRSVIVWLAIAAGLAVQAQPINSEKADFVLDTVARGLDFPWGLAFLPDGRFLVTERSGTMRYVSAAGDLSAPLSGLPEIAVKGQGGLMDVVLDPGFHSNQQIFFSYAAADDGGYGTNVASARLGHDALTEVKVIFRALPRRSGGRHFGSRLLFLADKSLLITLGDRGHRPNGQNLGTHPGSIVRIRRDGSVPLDNPFLDLDGVRPEIYTFGNRNVQGIALDTETGVVWANEHGPQGGCEINQVIAGSRTPSACSASPIRLPVP